MIKWIKITLLFDCTYLCSITNTNKHKKWVGQFINNVVQHNLWKYKDWTFYPTDHNSKFSLFDRNNILIVIVRLLLKEQLKMSYFFPVRKEESSRLSNVLLEVSVGLYNILQQVTESSIFQHRRWLPSSLLNNWSIWD